MSSLIQRLNPCPLSFRIVVIIHASLELKEARSLFEFCSWLKKYPNLSKVVSVHSNGDFSSILLKVFFSNCLLPVFTFRKYKKFFLLVVNFFTQLLIQGSELISIF